MAKSPPPTSITCADLGCVVLGPLLLQDTHLIELFGSFDRERIPERVVHARGGEVLPHISPMCPRSLDLI